MNIDLNDFVKKLFAEYKANNIYIENAFSMYLTKQKSAVSEASFSYYQEVTSYLKRWFDDRSIFLIDQIDNNVVFAYIDFCKSKGNKNSTINKRIKILKAVFNYLVDESIISNNPISKIKKLQETLPEIHIISKKDLKRIIDYADTLCLQSKLIIYLLISTGIRRTEITKIQRENINLDNNTIYLEQTKSRKPRNIYFDDRIKEMIINKISFSSSVYLFDTGKYQHISANTVSCIVKRIKYMFDIDFLSPHKFRHTFGTTILEETHDIETTRLLLGHSTYMMTQRYIHMNEKKLQKVATDSNPLKLL